MSGRAEISPCGRYRFLLTRRWDEGWPIRRCLFIMLNPSTADAETDDPTIRRCIGFAKREGCGALEVVNLYAYRTPSPKALFQASNFERGDTNLIVGERLMRTMVSAADRANLVICGWGAHGERNNASWRAAHALNRARKVGFALGETKSGQPRHPLYVKGDAPLEPWHVPIGAEIASPRAGGGS